jgi:monoamine oxidase
MAPMRWSSARSSSTARRSACSGWYNAARVQEVKGIRGSGAAALLALGKPGATAGALASLARALRMSRSAVEARLVSASMHDWSADPFSRGAYTYARTGGWRGFSVLARPMARTIYFAGEATCTPPDNGTVHGALASGERAAREVIADTEK